MVPLNRKKQLVSALSLMIYVLVMFASLLRIYIEWLNQPSHVQGPFTYVITLCGIWLAVCAILSVLLMVNKGRKLYWILFILQAVLVMATMGQASFVKNTSLVTNNISESIGDFLTALGLLVLALKEMRTKCKWLCGLNTKVLNWTPMVLILTGTGLKTIWLVGCSLKGLFSLSAAGKLSYLMSALCSTCFERLFHANSSIGSIMLFCIFLIFIGYYSTSE